ncbi:hypothetical protein SKAU_G00068720 [Synaphobranchus kaupii]|uniref:Uncharacterized protein n=1 Tax=Synaphobranchus kaupii TaxID=118154 RepID=A0A9Q1JBI2_SYNKA|nr:hypothetical protein SKAU_G00068720 [Synaphobranchus kaupii]
MRSKGAALLSAGEGGLVIECKSQTPGLKDSMETDAEQCALQSGCSCEQGSADWVQEAGVTVAQGGRGSVGSLSSSPGQGPELIAQVSVMDKGLHLSSAHYVGPL